MKLLVISRILEPASKKHTFERRQTYFEFEKEDAFSLPDVYRALSYYSEIDTSLQLHIHKQINENYGRNTNLIYYDVTNYYCFDFTKKRLSRSEIKKYLGNAKKRE
jgi:hypothetical protein